MAATRAGLTAFRQRLADPGSAGQPAAGRGSFNGRIDQYALYWSWYRNEAFEDLATTAAQWARYKSQYRLYKQTRILYNPVRRLVDFYAAQVYPGVLAIDGSRLPDGVPLAIPLAEDTPEALKHAIGQWWQWANWQAGKSVLVRYGGCSGDVLVELLDELDRGKITRNIVWPGLVRDDLQLDATGNVLFYAMEYRALAPDGTPYVYTKEVSKESIRTLRNHELFSYDGTPPEIENPYGFVPAVWCKHVDLGGDFGAPAIRAIGKLDQLNSMAAHIHDQMHKAIANPVVFWSGGSITNIFGARKNRDTEQQKVDIDLPDNTDRDSVLMLKGPIGGKVESLLGELNPAEALPWIESLLAEIEHDHPELSMYRELRAMSQVTGPAAIRLMGDVSGTVLEAQANYDQQMMKLQQMAVAMGGFRANSGAWSATPAQLTRQQKKFLPFDLESYARGELDHEIMPRPLVALTALEQLEYERARLELEADRAGVQTALQAGRIAGAAGSANPLTEKTSASQRLLAQAAAAAAAAAETADQTAAADQTSGQRGSAGG